MSRGVCLAAFGDRKANVREIAASINQAIARPTTPCFA